MSTPQRERERRTVNVERRTVHRYVRCLPPLSRSNAIATRRPLRSLHFPKFAVAQVQDGIPPGPDGSCALWWNVRQRTTNSESLRKTELLGCVPYLVRLPADDVDGTWALNHKPCTARVDLSDRRMMPEDGVPIMTSHCGRLSFGTVRRLPNVVGRDRGSTTFPLGLS